MQMNGNPSRAEPPRAPCHDVVVTRDPDELAAAMWHADVRYVPLVAARDSWRLAQVPLASGALCAGRMGAPTTGFGTVNQGVVYFIFRLGGAGTWVTNGNKVEADSIAVRCRSREVSLRVDQGIDWAVLYLAEESFAMRYRALTGRDLELRPGVCVHRGRAGEVRRLRLLVESGLALAEAGARDPEFLTTFEDMLIDEVVSVFEAPARTERPEYRRLIARCNDLLEAHPDAPFTPGDLCEALGVGERTLRRFFRATYGQNPARFLKLRRLASVRRALARGSRGRGAVTRAATSHGFYELGRFAADYRAVTGESPSETLRAAGSRRAEVSDSA